ncbi:MAG: tyrosine-type recombinase/integrase [Desulfobacterales bacterium]|nr:MAG: tyrosine-type recombinase/integrase [Desulfobacterales bacterium]
MQITNVIINFRRHLKRRNYSVHTVKYYLYIIRQYVLWLNVPLEKTSAEKIDAYIDYLHRKRMHPSSINLYLVILRVFYNYLKYDENIKLTNPVRRNLRLRVPKPLPKSLREQEVQQLLKAIDNKRDMAMFKLMLRCGLRVEELCNLTLGAVDLKGRRILVRQGKGGKDRVVYISDDAHDALIAYLKARSQYRIKKVFLVERGKYKGQPISVRGIQKRMEFYAKQTGIKVSCHRLRHTMATQLLNAEAEIETIQDLLGHNWITTTQRYCKISNLKVQKDYFKAMRRVQQRSVQPVFNPMLEPG